MNKLDIEKTLEQLKRVSMRDLISISTSFSLSNIDYTSALTFSAKNKVYPWEIDALLLMKIYLGEAEGKAVLLTENTFLDLISSIREFDYIAYVKHQSRTAKDLIPIIAANQFTIQIPIKNLLFRSLFFFNNDNSTFLNDRVNEMFGVEANTIHQVMVGLYSIVVGYKNEFPRVVSTFNKFLENDKMRKVIHVFTINIDNLRETLIKNHNNVIDFVHINYYLKQYCFISEGKEIFITYPHNFITVISYGLIYRLTEGSDEYRQKFGKEILENYLLYLCKLNKNFKKVLRSFKYNRNMNETSDVIALIGSDCLFLESKSSVISKEFRDPNNLVYDAHYLELYANSLMQLYKCIKKHNDGQFYIDGITFKKEKCFGVVVNFEDSNISRESIYSSFFEKYHLEFGLEVSEDFKEWVFNHMRVIDLTQFENVLMYNVENPIKKIFSIKHTDLTFSFSNNELQYKKVVSNKVSKLLNQYLEIILDFMK